MTIFSRRAIQRMLSENAEWMRPGQAERHIKTLNDPTHDPLPTEWEVAVLNSLAKFIELEHEPEVKSGAIPDIVFRSSSNEVSIVADITVVTDRGLRERNPVERLEEEFQIRARQIWNEGIKGGFGLSVGSQLERKRGRGAPPTQLHIPPIGRFKTVIFNQRFEQFIDEIRRSPETSHRFEVRTTECSLNFSFSPRSTSWTSDRPVFTRANSLNRNPVWNALDQKRKQLARVEIAGKRGIILCNGDCELLTSGSDCDSFGIDEIVLTFLKKHRSIEFVLTLNPRIQPGARDLKPGNHYLEHKLYHRGEDNRIPDFLEPITQIGPALPKVMLTAANARHLIEWMRETGMWNQGRSFVGGWSLSDKRIEISSRALLQLLAGRLGSEEFAKMHSFHGGNPFLHKLLNGQTIVNMRTKRSDVPEDDDEWMVFEFGDPDPSITPFHLGTIGNRGQN